MAIIPNTCMSVSVVSGNSFHAGGHALLISGPMTSVHACVEGHHTR